MKRYIVFLFFIFSTFSGLYATHLVGGYAGYEFIRRIGNTNNYEYKVYFKVYRDCSRAGTLNDVPFDENMKVCIYVGNGNHYSTINIPKGIPRKVDPVGSTDCAESTRACVDVSVYEQIIILPQSNFGYILKWARCCRNSQNNIPDEYFQGTLQPSQGQTYLTRIPPTNIVDDSPYFTEVPVPYICINDTTQIRSYAIDPDGDSLVFRFAKPWGGGELGDAIPKCENFFTTPTPIVYSKGYDENQPFGPSGYASINPSTGTMTVMATQLGRYALAVDVDQYRNGILIGTVRLDIQLLVINCPPNNKPYLSSASSVFKREVIAGEKLCFDISAFDIDQQNVKISAFGEIFTGGPSWIGPTATLPTKSGFKGATTTFCWQTSCEQGRAAPYTFVLEAIDDGCPPKYINETYYIYVKPFEAKLQITGPSPICPGIENATYKATNIQAGSTIEWSIQNGTILSGQGSNSVSVKWDITKSSGVIEAFEKSKNGCVDKKVNLSVKFAPKPATPQITSYSSLNPLVPDDTVCVGNSLYLVPSSETIKNARTYTWITHEDKSIQDVNPLVFTPNEPGKFLTKLFYISQDDCPSDTAYKTVVALQPTVSKIFGPRTVCPNSRNIEFYVEGEKGAHYQWIIDGAVIQKGQGTDTVAIAFADVAEITLKVIETIDFGCVGDTIYHKIKITYDLEIDKPLGEFSVCEFTNREKYIPSPVVNNSTYQWEITGGEIDEIDSNYFILYANWGKAGQGSISYFQSAFDTLNGKGCVSNKYEAEVQINPIPDASQIEGVFEVCQYSEDLIFIVKGFENSTYKWVINGNTSISGQGTNTISFPTNNIGEYTISVQEISEYGCEGEIIDSVFIIHPFPVTTPIMGDSVLCHPNFLNIKYEVRGFETSTFHWNIEEGVSKDSSSLKPNIFVDWFGTQNSLISVYEKTDFGCIGDVQKLNVFIDSIGIDIKVVTVAPPPARDKQIIVNWELINAPRYNNTFKVYKRSVDPENNYFVIGETPGNVFTFTEENVNTKITPYDFQIKGKDLCNNEISSPVHRTILLTGSKEIEYASDIEFTNYLGWHQDVLQYVINRKLIDKTEYEEYDYVTYPSKITYENGIEHFTQCYRIKAIENQGREEESWSNEVCFNFPPLMYVPNAFSPNGNGINDNFGPTAAALKTYRMTIFNRWGEKLFVTEDLSETWDGVYKGVECKQDIYVFFIEYSDFADKKYTTKGTFSLLR